jgi:hypothetical protein
MDSFAPISNGRQTWNPNHSVSRHRHDPAYVALVLSGSYEECGSRGRFCVGPGDVLVHNAFDAHLDRCQKQGAQILNLVVGTSATNLSFGRVGDPDAIARAAERDLLAADAQLRTQLRAANSTVQDWPDMLATDLLRDPDCRLEIWARSHGLAAATVSRGFGKVSGVTPESFRMEARARGAFALNATPICRRERQGSFRTFASPPPRELA